MSQLTRLSVSAADAIRNHLMSGLRLVFFFFQAEDGIRDDLVTGVQTCALPIWAKRWDPMTIPTFAGRATAQLRRRHGPSWDCWPSATRAANAWPAVWRIFCARRAKTVRGMRFSTLEPASRVCSI